MIASNCTSNTHPDGCSVGWMTPYGCACDCHQYDEDEMEDDDDDDE